MSFLKRFFTAAYREGSPPASASSFEHLSEEELEAHLGVARYGDFLLTDAVRPSYDLQVIPQQGYRHDYYHDEQNRTRIPVIMASVSKPQLFELFMELLEPLGMVVDVVLETSHDRQQAGHADLYREHIDMPVLKSILYEYEDLLLNDGCAGLAVLNPRIPQEVQFDEHKLLIVYGQRLKDFEHILERHGVRCDEQMKFITEAEHVHSSSEEFAEQFRDLSTRLGIDCAYAKY